MKVIDTDIFVIAALHRTDQRFAINNALVQFAGLHSGEFATTIFNKLEAIGVCSLAMSMQQLRRFSDGRVKRGCEWLHLQNYCER